MTIFCIGRNYSEHARELNNPLPSEPVVFMKPSTALLIDNKPFYYPDFTNDLHHELELVFKVSKPGKKISKEKALEHISHITVGIDFTARDIQQRCKEKSLPWEIAKAFDHSALVGEWQALSNEIKEYEFSLLKNGEEVQRGISTDMVFNIADIIQYISTYFKLSTGDLIFTGTPSGVGPIKVGDELKGFLQNQQKFFCQIK
jgi:acylpyruvate hydrolase